MRILYTTHFGGQKEWGAEVFLNRAFHSLGHATHCVDQADRYRLYHSFRHAPDCDAFFLQQGDFFPVPLIRAVSVPRFFWDTELPFRFAHHGYIAEPGLFQHVFLWTPELIDHYVEKGWATRDKCSVLKGALDPSLHRKLPDVHKDIDVLFVGSLTPRRQSMLDQVRKHFNVATPTAFGPDLVRLVNRAKIVLNLHATEFVTTETRVFEVLGCEALLLTERLSRDNPFTADELVEFSTPHELVGKIRFFLERACEREVIARNGRTAALLGHTYLHRAKEIVEVMSHHVGHGNETRPPMLRANLGFKLRAMVECIQHPLGSCRKSTGALLRKGRASLLPSRRRDNQKVTFR